MASSVEWLDLYANWKGSREGRRADLMWRMTSRSKHFMRIGVSATGRATFGTGMMVVALKHVGTTA